MRASVPRVLIHARLRGAGPLLWLAVSACVLPTERSGQTTVQITGLPEDLIVGDSVRVTAVVADSAGRPVPNALVVFSSSAEDVVRVSGTGLVRALAVGSAEVVATVAGQENAGAASAVRVHPIVDVDSVHPDTVRFGDTLVVYGVAADPEQTAVLVGGVRAPVKHVDLLGTGGRAARFVVWAPVGAPTVSGVTLRIGARTSNAAGPVTVIQEDLYELPYNEPYDLGALEQDFFNPELAVEPVTYPDGPLGPPLRGSDTYILADSMVRGRTFTFAGDVDLELQYTSFDYQRAGLIATISGTRGFYESGCRNGYTGYPALSFPLAGDTVRLPLAGMSGGRYTVVAGFPYYVERSVATRYVLGIANGAATDLPPDALEGDDVCRDPKPIPIGGAPLSLNIHSALDIDWLKVVVDTAMFLRVRVEFAGPDNVDLSLWDFVTMGTPSWDWNSGPPVVRTDSTSKEVAGRALPGTYLLMLYSYFAVPMPYTLRIEATTGAALAAARVAAPAPRREEAGRRHWIVRTPDSGPTRP